MHKTYILQVIRIQHKFEQYFVFEEGQQIFPQKTGNKKDMLCYFCKPNKEIEWRENAYPETDKECGWREESVLVNSVS